METEADAIICAECDAGFQTSAELRRHAKRAHAKSAQVNLYGYLIDIKRSANGFFCPVPDCTHVSNLTDSFQRHVQHKHGNNKRPRKGNETSTEEEETEEEEYSFKLRKVGSHLFKTTKHVSQEELSLSRDDAILSASSAFHLSKKEQTQKLLLAEAGDWDPVVLAGVDDDVIELCTLASPSIVSRLVTEQPMCRFKLPLRSLIIDDTSDDAGDDDDCLWHIIKNGPSSNVLTGKKYIEANSSIINTINEDWCFTPQMRYATSLLFAGSILLEGTTALLVNCVEPYGRSADVDAHFERAGSDSDGSWPIPDQTSGRYDGLCVVSINEDAVKKLKIGLRSSNLLVTSSIRVDNELGVEVGPSTSNFHPCKNTRIFLDAKSIKAAKLVIDEEATYQLYPDDKLSQLKQIRSKFHQLSTYALCRASSALTNRRMLRPVTIWTLAHCEATNGSESQDKKASKLLQKIAQAVIISGKTSKLQKAVVVSMMSECRGSLAQHMEKIIRLFADQQSMAIIENTQLNAILTAMVSSMSTAIRAENSKVKEKVVAVYVK